MEGMEPSQIWWLGVGLRWPWHQPRLPATGLTLFPDAYCPKKGRLLSKDSKDAGQQTGGAVEAAWK